MGGSTKQTSTIDSTTKTSPYDPAIPGVNTVVNQLTPSLTNVQPTATENNAITGLANNAAAGNPYAPAIGGVATSLLNGGTDRTGIATDAYSQLKAGLTPYATMDTNPYTNPAFAQLVTNLTNDTTNSIKSQYAGAGYSPTSSGDYSQTLGRGIAQGVAPTFLQAYNDLTNQKTGAINSIYGAGNTTTGILSGLDQTALANKQAGIGASTDALNANDSALMRQLQVAQMQRGLPLSNIGNAESLLLPIAQLGGTSQTNGTQTTDKSSNPGLLGIAQGIGGLFSGGASSAFSGMGGPGLLGWLGTKLG